MSRSSKPTFHLYPEGGICEAWRIAWEGFCWALAVLEMMAQQIPITIGKRVRAGVGGDASSLTNPEGQDMRGQGVRARILRTACSPYSLLSVPDEATVGLCLTGKSDSQRKGSMNDCLFM
jgi:hypothetical protein